VLCFDSKSSFYISLSKAIFCDFGFFSYFWFASERSFTADFDGIFYYLLMFNNIFHLPTAKLGTLINGVRFPR